MQSVVCLVCMDISDILLHSIVWIISLGNQDPVVTVWMTCLDVVNRFNPVATCLGRREQRLERLECMTLEALNLGGVMSISED